jgi:hypothetical protein
MNATTTTQPSNFIKRQQGLIVKMQNDSLRDGIRTALHNVSTHELKKALEWAVANWSADSTELEHVAVIEVIFEMLNDRLGEAGAQTFWDVVLNDPKFQH